MHPPNVEWIIKGEPREVQLEALRRSYYGFALKDSRDGPEDFRVLRPTGMPAVGWGHLMEMRLGKTPTILNEFALLHRDHGFETLVVLSPNSYKEDWAMEAEKYGLPVPAWPYHQSKVAHAVDFVQKTKGQCALIVNYEATYQDTTLGFLEPLIGPKTMVAADESIRLKDPNGLFFKAAMVLSKNAGAVRIATGLPITQGPQDFYAQARVIRMYSGYNFYAYRGKFCRMGGFKAKKVVGVKNEKALYEQISQNGFIAKRKDWGNQTPAEYYTLRLRPSEVQKRHYEDIDKEFVTTLDDGTEISADQVMAKLMKMQQISSGFVYDDEGRAVEIMDPLKTPKIKRLLEFVEDELVGKLVVPYHYAKTGDMLLSALKKHQPAVIRGDEWMRGNARNSVSEKTRFNHDPACRVMILQTSAGKYGHDLSGNENDRCTTQVFFENTYSLDDRLQIEARNTTAFQSWPNLYFDLVSSPIERKAVEALARKENIAEAVLGVYREGKTRIVRE
jgi:hypothetical protein